MKTEIQAINTKGFWYAYVAVDGKYLYWAKEGFKDRNDAIADGRAWLSVYKSKKLWGQT